MTELQGMAVSVAPTNLPVLIEGESGTGKETLARHIHCLHGGSGAFLRLYCGQPEQLAEAHSTGTYTLFLKNVQLLPPALQPGVLRTLQAAEGVRLMASSTGPLERQVARGEFSADLYFRLSACRLALPPLRQRQADIPMLFLELLARFRSGTGNGCGLDSRLEQALMAYPWRGNFRELENIARRYVIAPDSERLAEELERSAETLPSLKEQVRLATKGVESEIILRTLEQHQWNRRRAAQTLKISYRALMYKMKALRGANVLGGAK